MLAHKTIPGLKAKFDPEKVIKKDLNDQKQSKKAKRRRIY